MQQLCCGSQKTGSILSLSSMCSSIAVLKAPGSICLAVIPQEIYFLKVEFSGAERAEPHLTPRLSGAIRKKWSKKLLWRAKQAFEDGTGC